MDGKIDYSGYSLKELHEAMRSIDRNKYPINFSRLETAIAAANTAASNTVEKPRVYPVDLSSPTHKPPNITWLTFRARCPMCNWVLPYFHKESRRFARPFPCSDCGTALQLTRFWRSLNRVLMSFLVPFVAWISFSESGKSSWPYATVVLIVLSILNYWFERLEVVDESI